MRTTLLKLSLLSIASWFLTLTVLANPATVHSNNLTVTDHETILIGSSVDTSHCIIAGDSVFIGIDTVEALSFEWSPASDLSDSDTTQTWASPLFPTTYTLTLTYPTGTCQYNFYVDVAPTFNKGNDVTLCQEGTSTIGGNALPGWSYTWLPITNLSDPNIARPVYSATQTTGVFQYIVTGTHPARACETVDTILVEVVNDNADAGPDATYCSGTSFTIGTPAKPNVIYNWTGDAGLSDQNIAQPTATPSGDVLYILNTLNNITGCTSVDSINLTEIAGVVADAGGSSIFACPDGSAAIGGADESGAGITYSWTPTAGLDNPTGANPTATPAATTMYTLTATNPVSGCVAVDSVLVEVIDCNQLCPTLDSLVLSETEICNGASIDAEIYRSQNIESVSLHYNTGAVLSAADIYAGSATTINPNIPIDESIVINEVTYFGGDTIELWNIGADTIDIASYWVCSRFNYEELINLNIESGDLVLEPGTYVVLTGFPLDDQSADLGLYSTNQFTSSADMVDFVQYGASGIGRESVAAAKGIWTAGTFVPWVASPGESISYDGSGNDESDWAQYSAATYGADNDNISSNVSTTISAISLPDNNTANPIVYNIYAALGSGNPQIEQCSLLVTTTITVNPNPTLTIGADQSICEGNTAVLSIAGGDTYTWSPATDIDDINATNPKVNPSSTTIYYVDVVDANGCTNRDSVVVTVLPIPSLSTTDSGICAGESISLSSVVSDANGTTGTLSYFNTLSDAISESNGISETVSPTATTIYYIRKNTASSPACYDIASVTITIVSAPDLVTSGASTCPGSFVDISSKVSDNNNVPTGVSFYPSATDADNETNVITGTFVNPSVTTTYYARKNAEAPGMCYDVEPLTITVNTTPDLVTVNDTICFGSAIDLTTLVTDNNATVGSYTFFTSLSDAENNINAVSNPVSPLDMTEYFVRKATSTTPPCRDIESVMVYVKSCMFDIALKKTLSSGQSATVNPGDPINYDITVYNQGIVTAYDIRITDYLDVNTSLNDAGWIASGMNATTTIDEIAVNDSVVLTLQVLVDPTFMGTSIVNGAEVSFATNIDGRLINIEDEDSTPDNINGNDLLQNDNISDDGTVDEDDHDEETVQVQQRFDLALTHTFSTGAPASYLPGDIVSLEITVTNEGTLNAYDVSVINYDVPGLIYLDGGWTDENGYYSFALPQLGAGAFQSLTLRYTVDPQFTGQSITNNSEVGFATLVDGSNNSSIDEDSTPDSDETNGLTEDDFSSLPIAVTQGFDLALRKTLAAVQSSPVYTGDNVLFDIQVYNQGIEDAYDIVITDYLPANTTLVSSTWTMNGSNAEFTIAELLVGQDTTVQIEIQVNAGFTDNQLINTAEISFATDVDNSGILKDDQDSDFDANPSDLGGGVNVAGQDDEINDRGVNDEDDHDPEDVIVCNIEINDTPTNPTCNAGSDGSIDINIVGGTAPYMYQWSDGNGFGEDLTGITSGTYTISVTDANGCQATSNITLTDPSLFTFNAVTTNADCGMADGSITLSIAGATPQTYDWSDDSFDGLSTLTGLTAGTFDVTVTDDQGCQQDTIIIINSSSGLTITSDARDISCEGADDGFIGLVTTGGTAPYSYDWSDDAFDGLDTLENLVSGTYAITVEDANNCVFISSFMIEEPAAIAVDTAVQGLACANDGNGIIDLDVSGGTEPYSYIWNNGLPAQQDHTGLSAGNYQYTVTDANGCLYSDSVIILNPTQFLISAVSNAPICEGETLEITGTNGVTYDWIGPNGFTSSDDILTFANATPSLNGTYTLRASSQNACRDTIDVAVEIYPVTPTASLNTSATVCNRNLGNNENGIDLNSLITGGDMSGVWSDTDASGALVGSIFSATPSMEGLTYEFTYTILGAGDPSGDCGDRTYAVFVMVDGCGFVLSLDKSVSVSGDLGDTVTYTITVTNNGDADAYDVEIKDHMPSGFTFSPALNTDWAAAAGGATYIFDDPILMGQSQSVDISLIIDTDHQASSITNSAEVTFASASASGPLAMDTNSTYDNFTGTILEDDESAATIELTQSYDLALDMAFITGQAPELSAGDPVTYNVIVTNEGSLDAFDVGLRLDYPIDLTLDAGSSAGWTDMGTYATYTLANITSGSTDTIPVSFNLISGSQTISATTIAEITGGSSTAGGSQENDSDSSPANGVPTEDDYATLTIAIDHVYDLALAISTTTDTVDAGDQVSFDLTITNESTVPADDITVVVYVPEGMTFPSSLNPGWTLGSNRRYYFTFTGGIGVGLSSVSQLILNIGNNTLSGVDLTVATEIVSGSFMSGGILLSDSDGTFDDISSNDPASEDNHASLLLYIRTSGCSSIDVNDIIVTSESCVEDDGAILIDITNPTGYDYSWAPDAGLPNSDNNERSQLASGRYLITITDKSDANCTAQTAVDVNYSCTPAIDTFFAYVPYNSIKEICLDASYINLPKSASSSFMCYDGSGMNPPSVTSATTNNPECIMLESILGFVGKASEMLCVIHCTDDIVPVCDTTMISVTVMPETNIEKVQIPAGTASSICLGSQSLQLSTLPTSHSVCDFGEASTVAVSSWDGSCITLNPAPGFSGISSDTICVISCYNDDPQFCDTTYICVEVTSDICPDYFDQSLIVQAANDTSDMMSIVVNAGYTDFLNNYTLTNDGVPYTGSLTPTDYDSLRYYEVDATFDTYTGPFDIQWTADGVSHSGTVQDVFEFIDTIQSWDPAGNWTFNPNLRRIETKDLSTAYSIILVDAINYPSLTFEIALRVESNPLKTIIEVPTGFNQLIIPEICPDTLTIAFAAPTYTEVFDTIYVDEVTDYCIDISELTSNPVSVIDDCADENGDNATITIVGNDPCLDLEGLAIGMDTACIIITDEYGFVDTTKYYVYVRDTSVGPPIVISDTIQLFKNQFANIPILMNDDTISAITSLDIISQPLNGTAYMNPDNTIRFDPDLDYCSDTETQIIQYMLCNIDGCSRGIIEIQVLCDELAVNNGFSPNGDGVNDAFYIDAALLYPNNELRVYNRWGSQVMIEKGYKNDWEGDWDGQDLPDGVYWYTFDTGEGKLLSGFVVLYRH